MRVRHHALLILIASVVLTAAAARAQRPGSETDPERRFSQFLAVGQGLAAFVQAARRDFRDADRNMDGVVSAADAALRAEYWQHFLRSYALAELMRNDLDLDGVVTRDEVVRAQTERVHRNAYLTPGSEINPQQRIDQAVEAIMRADRDGDGRIDLAEMLAFVKQKPLMPDTDGTRQDAVIMAMDADGDGAVTPAEFDQAVERVFRAADTDGDGVVSKEELDHFRARKSAEYQAEITRTVEEHARQRAEARVAACLMPKASEAARVVVLRTGASSALSTVALLSQDVAVETTSLEIEPGDGPLYLIVVTHNPTIWRLSGAVERVERLVLSGGMTGPNRSDADQPPIAGATGIAADKVTFLRRAGCIPNFTLLPSSNTTEAVAMVRDATGHAPELRAEGEGTGIALPSARVIKSEPSPQELVVRDVGGALRIERGPNAVVRDGRSAQSSMRRFHEGGIVEIDPAGVVASHPVERYAVLPEEAGLIQLVQAGVLVEMPASGDLTRPTQFSVRARMRFPAGLYGAHQARFVIAPGVPLPEGDPGHSCVMMEATGQPVANAQICAMQDRR